MRKVRIINAPFSLIGLPSLEVASLKAFLTEKKIDVSVEHAYLRFADYLGGDKYKILRITDIGERIFSSLLFGEVYNKNKNAATEILKESGWTFDDLSEEIHEFVSSYIDGLKISSDEIVLFYMYSQQLLPALYFAKRIKEEYGCTIWLAGYNCKSKMGVSILDSFPFVDQVFAEEIEENIFHALNPEVPTEYHDNLDFLPTPDYSDYFLELDKCSEKFRFERASLYYLQVEFTRGCWWNQCSFCTLNCRTYGFREHSIEKIIKDYEILQRKYCTTQIIVAMFVNNKNWKNVLIQLSKRFPALKNAYSINFKISALLEPNDFSVLKETGASILVGTESFSEKYLSLLNKGQTVIENIQVLKFAERWGVPCYHNLMYAFPFETEEFYKESEENISFIYHLPPPFDDEEFRLTYDSPIFKDLKRYNIKSIDFRREKEADLFPDEIKKNFIPFFYDFKSGLDGIDERKNKWLELIKTWRDIYYVDALNGRPKQTSLLNMNSNEWVLQIRDARYGMNQHVYSLTGYRRKIYEFCDQIKQIDEMVTVFSELSYDELQGILHEFVEHKLMFHEKGKYLSLAI